jgi:hypothetical protein
MKSGCADAGTFIPIGMKLCSWAFVLFQAMVRREARAKRAVWLSAMTSPSLKSFKGAAHLRYCTHMHLPRNRLGLSLALPPRTASPP